MRLFKNKPDCRKIANVANGIGRILSTVIIWMIVCLLVWICLVISGAVIGLIPAISGYMVASMTTIEIMLSVIALCAVCFICIIGFVLPFVLIYMGVKLGKIFDNIFPYEPKKIEDPLFEDD